MINPEGGRGGKAPRRRAVSMDNGSKYTKTARGRAAKKKAALQAAQRVRWRTYLLVVCPSGQEVPLPGAAMNWNPVGLIFAHELTPTLAP